MAVASYILGAFRIYGGVSGLLFRTMTFGVEDGASNAVLASVGEGPN